MTYTSWILRIEGFFFLMFAAALYYFIGASWWLFVGVLFVPDISMVGYMKDAWMGAVVYNIGHTYLFPFTLFIIGSVFDVPILLPLSLIWISHISMDRALGFGLKYTDGFRHTHLGKIG